MKRAAFLLLVALSALADRVRPRSGAAAISGPIRSSRSRNAGYFPP